MDRGWRSAWPMLVLLAPLSRIAADLPTDGDAHAAARALLTVRCVDCHGPDTQESHLRLDTRAGVLTGGDFGPAVVLGKGAASELVRRIRSTKPSERMPPDGERLTDAEVAALATWIDAGAPWPGADGPEPAARDERLDHWAWQPVKTVPVPPAVAAFAGLPAVEPERNAIDFFVRRALAERGLAPAPVADRRTLIRRLSFDLLGLPPDPADVEAFVADPDPNAYETLVDKLLASPRHGERWARHWLDVVHYGDTHGYDKDKPRPNAWPYRDYVIRALNDDKPYARFVAEQIAGDVLWPDTRDGQEALGFLAAGPWDFIGHVEVPETKTDGKIARHLDRDDMVATTIGTFASVTVHCAQCHAHKFDPVSQDDYYSLQAVFAAVDRDDRPYAADPQVARTHAELAARLDALAGRRRDLEARVREAAGPRLEELDRAIAALPKPAGPNPTPAYGWHSAIEAGADVAKWVQVDLGAERAIHEIVLHPCHDEFAGIGAGFGYPRRFRVEVANDPEFRDGVTTVAAFTEADVANPGTKPQTFSCGTGARHVRITATKLAPRQNDFIFALAELVVRTADGTNLAAGAAVTAADSIEAPPRWGRANLVDGTSPAGSDDTAAPLREERERLLAAARDPDTSAALEAVASEITAAEAARAALPPLARVYSATSHKRQGQPRPIHVLSRGNVLAPTREVGPGTLSAVGMLAARFELPPGHAEGERRAALARWLVDPANPLTWRSAVNRVWHYHFGRGLVDTPSDFGRMGARPSHPDLLDWLAATFRDGGGSLKSLHRLIVTSATYRQQSASRADAAAVDSDNTLVWRQQRRRLEAEGVRDAVLAVSGALDLTMGGPGWQDFKVERPEHSPHYRYDLADPADRSTWRRGVYRFVVRSQTQPFMTSLDCADPSMRVEKRTESISAPQALALLNNGFMLVQSHVFAERVAREAGPDLESQVTRAFLLGCGRPPEPAEVAALVDVARDHGMDNVCRALFNLAEFTFVD